MAACPFCGLPIGESTDAADEPTVEHAVPLCRDAARPEHLPTIRRALRAAAEDGDTMQEAG